MKYPPPNKNRNLINLVFVCNDDMKKIIIQADKNKIFREVVNKYHLKTGKINIGEFYIFNGRKINDNSLVSEIGFMDGSLIYVISIKNVIVANNINYSIFQKK